MREREREREERERSIVACADHIMELAVRTEAVHFWKYRRSNNVTKENAFLLVGCLSRRRSCTCRACKKILKEQSC